MEEFDKYAHGSDGDAHKESKVFAHSDKALTVSVYALIVGLFWVICVIVGINVHLIPEVLKGLVSVLSPLLYGFFIAFIIAPCVSFIEKRIFCKWRGKYLRLKHVLSIVLAYIFIFTLIVVCVIFLVPQIISTYNELSDQLSNNLVNLRNWIAGILDKMPGAKPSGSYIYYNISSDYRMDVGDLVIADTLNTPYGGILKPKNTASQIEVQAMIDKVVQNVTASLQEALPGMLSSAWNILVEAKNILLGLIISVYFLVCKKSILGTIQGIAHTWMPLRVYRRASWLVTKAKGIFRDYIVVRILDSFIVALITFIGLLIIRNPYALLLSVVIAVSALIPFIGPVIGIAVCTFIMFFIGFGYAVGFCAVMIGVQLLDDRVIEPLLYRGYSQHRLAGIWIFSAIIIMSGFFGIWGFLFGIPVFAFIYSVVKDWSERRLRRAGLETDTESYGFVSFKMRSEPRKAPSILEHFAEGGNDLEDDAEFGRDDDTDEEK